jgi:hypothetical protein
MLGVRPPTTRHQYPEQPGSEAVVQIQQMGVPPRSQLGRHSGQCLFVRHPKNPIEMGVVAQQWYIHLFGEHADACGGVTLSDRPKQRRGQENVSDRAEPHRENV